MSTLSKLKLELITLPAVVGLLSCASASQSPRVAPVTSPPENGELHKSINGWRRISDAPTDRAATNIQCVSEKVCWIFTAEQLWRSENGGENWKSVFLGSASQGPYQYHFISESLGWRYSAGTISKTLDGGMTWIDQASPLSGQNGNVQFLVFKNLNEGWLAGGLYRPLTKEEERIGVPNNQKDPGGKRVLEEAIYRTADGGATWQREPLSPESSGRIIRLVVSPEGPAVALGEYNFYYFDHRHKSWKPAILNPACVGKRYSDDDYGTQPVCASVSKHMVVALDDGGLVQSDDGGRTWCDLMHPGELYLGEARGYFVDLHFDKAEHGWALSGNLQLYETNDGGRSWKLANSELQVQSMSFGNNFGFLLSRQGIYRIDL
jgi:photosystem II stability/assembly factor-like uncharacterized protein